MFWDSLSFAHSLQYSLAMRWNQQPPYWRIQPGELQSQIHVVCITAQEQSLCRSEVVTLSLHLGKEKRALKMRGGMDNFSEAKTESQLWSYSSNCGAVTWGLHFSVHLLMVLFTLLWFASWWGLVVHTFGFYFKLNLAGRCALAAYECSGSSNLPEMSTEYFSFLWHWLLGSAHRSLILLLGLLM